MTFFHSSDEGSRGRVIQMPSASDRLLMGTSDNLLHQPAVGSAPGSRGGARQITFPPDSLLASTAQSAQRYARASRSKATEKAYESDWRDFTIWCNASQLLYLPAVPDTVRLYIAALADKGFKVSTITRRLLVISVNHRQSDYPSPCDMRNVELAKTWLGIRRTLGVHQFGKTALTLEHVRSIIASAGDTLRASRDRALILVGFVGGMRCSELAAIRVEHLIPNRGGITILLPSSKTDQEKQGRVVELVRGKQPDGTPEDKLTCPVRAIRLWMERAEIKAGPVFRNVTIKGELGLSLHPNSIRRIVKVALRRTGLDADLVREFAAHSLRAGFVTTSYRNGAREVDIAEQTGHKSLDVLRRYIRNKKSRESAARKLGM